MEDLFPCPVQSSRLRKDPQGTICLAPACSTFSPWVPQNLEGEGGSCAAAQSLTLGRQEGAHGSEWCLD